MARSRIRPHSHPARTARDLPTLSVVLPSYNVAPWLERCLDSLLHQAPPELREIIVVDDGSPDETGEIAERRASADSRIRVLHQTNAGVAAARNAGMDAACGEYVGFVDPDDMVDPNWARSLLQAAGRQRPAIVRGEWREVTFDGRPPPPHPTCTQALSPTPLTWLGPLWCAIYRRDFIVESGLRHPVGRVYSQDLDFTVHAVVAALIAGERILPCPQACYVYLRRPDGNDRKVLSAAHMASILGILEGLHQLLLQHQRQLPPQGMALQYHQWIVNLYGSYAPRAEVPADAAAARALARRLLSECPVPHALRQINRAQLSRARSSGGPVHPALQALLNDEQALAAGPSASAAAAVAVPDAVTADPAPPSGPPLPEWPPEALSGTAAGADLTRPMSSPDAEAEPGAENPCAPLLQRARQLLGEAESGDGDAAELTRLLRRLYRAQPRLDVQALRELARDCLQQEAEDAQVREAAAALAGEGNAPPPKVQAGDGGGSVPAAPAAMPVRPPSAPPEETPPQAAPHRPEVVIAFSFNDSYCPLAAAALASLLSHVSPGYRYVIHILQDDISAYNRRRLQSLNPHPHVTLHFLGFDVQGQTRHDLNYSRHSRYAFARLWLPQLLEGCERVLYLDADLLINADPADLFFTDLKGRALGAVADALAGVPPAARTDFLRRDGFPYDTVGNYITRHLGLPAAAQRSYFCTGVLLMDLKRCGPPLERRLPELLGRKFRFLDQDILNIIFEHDKCLLERGWNVFAGEPFAQWLREHDGQLPPILHFNGRVKPDADPRLNFPGNAEYWRVLAGTPFFSEALERRMAAMIRAAQHPAPGTPPA